MYKIAIVLAVLIWPLTLKAGEWNLTLGDLQLEGISVDQSIPGDTYHLGLTSEAVWLMFAFPSDNGARPYRARAARINMNGFEPSLQCVEIGSGGLILEGGHISGEVICSQPKGNFRLEAQFE